MKVAVSVTEVDDEGLEGLLGERVTVWCLNYIYAGKLEGVNDKCIKLTEASVVYETGPLTQKGYTDAQKVEHPIYVMIPCIESFTREV
jgi:hypothetical protein